MSVANKLSVANEPKANERRETSVVSVFQAIEKGWNIFLTGPGGCGKTYTIQQIMKIYPNCHVTATTGIAALGISDEARTLHSWAGIGLAQDTTEEIIKELYKKPFYLKTWRMCKLLIIDEVSMLGMYLFEMLDKIAKTLRGNELPFGGIQVIFSGDFMQLPPVKDEFVFKSDLWNAMKFHVIELTEPKRYDDLKWFEILKRIRVGEHTKEDIEILRSRYELWRDKKREIYAMDVKPTVLFATRKNVNIFNKKELDKIDEELYEFESKDSAVKFRTTIDVTPYKAKLEEQIPEVLHLKVGAQVMIKRNNIPIGIVNGTRGVVTKIEHQCVTVKLVDGSEIPIVPVEYKIKLGNIKIYRIQFPLMLAWATTIHKSQGLTLDRVLCTLGQNIFEEGQAYVALSRVRNLDGLFISQFDENCIMANEDVLASFHVKY